MFHASKWVGIHRALSVYYTVKPLLTDPPRSGQSLYNGHRQWHQPLSPFNIVYFEPPRYGQPLYSGQRTK